MLFDSIWVVLFLLFLAVKDCINSQGNRRPSVLAEDVYEALVNLAEGKSQPPVKQRTKAIRTAATRYWRAKGLILVKEDRKGKKTLYLEGRRMIKSSEVKK